MSLLNRTCPARVLLVDDEESIHSAYRTILSAKRNTGALDDLEAELFGEATTDSAADLESPIQFSITHALQGEEAVELAAKATVAGRPFEVAFIDMRMPPGIDGLETIERLWKIDPLLQVVICTAFSDYSWTEVILRLGSKDNLLLLKKPFANEEVLQLATALAQKHRAVLETRLQIEQLREANDRLQHEIGHRQLAENKLAHAATHDHLTKLPNRNYLKTVLAQRFDEQDLPPLQTDALIFMDLDNFKLVNDSLGHVIGDELLIQIAGRLQAALDEYSGHDSVGPAPVQNLVARLGGDEFVLFLADVESQDSAIRFAETIRTEVCCQYELGGNSVAVGASLGIAFSSSDMGSTAEQMMRNADLAMYRAKFTGKRCLAVFDQEMHAAVLKRLELEDALRDSLQDGYLHLVFQPIFNVASGKIIGLESLLRWDHPEIGTISPNEFIPIAEETGLIVPIGKWVLEEACRTIRQLNLSLAEENRVMVAVNVSKRQIVAPGFVRMLEQILRDNQIAGNQLNLEITESMIMDNPEEIVDILHEIRKLGVRLYMDDFGTGHSSLSCLHRFPIDVLKIDRSFVSTMEANDDYETIIHAIIALAHNLGTQVVAEGIETENQLGRLRDIECDLGQGYYFSEPRPIADLLGLLSGSETSLAHGFHTSNICNSEQVAHHPIPFTLGMLPITPVNTSFDS